LKPQFFNKTAMKILQYFLTILILIAFIGTYSCKKKHEGPSYTDQQKQAILLEGTWTTSSVDAAPTGVDQSAISSLTLTFNIDSDKNPTTFSSTGAPDFFTTQSSSTWDFSGTGTTIITLTNVSPITTLTVDPASTETTLKVSFTLPQLRTEDLHGDYSLTLTK
jgi:hypothetical protein